MPIIKRSVFSPPVRIIFAVVLVASIYVLYDKNSESSKAQKKVDTAIQNTELDIKKLSEAANISFPPKRVFFRAFKSELELEIWGANSDGEPFKLLKTYTIAKSSGRVGPKRKEGDFQVPEGVYYIDRFNPNSSYHLSLGLNYPNKSDEIRGDQNEPGTDIFIHGSNVSVGCLAMTDPIIEEIYALAHEAKEAGQRKIPVHIFPARFDSDIWKEIKNKHSDNKNLLDFWAELEPIYNKFNETRIQPKFSIAIDGSYSLVQ